MSTRSLTAVKIDNEYKVAEFGYYDGYPKGQGKEVLDFLRNKMIKEKFLKKIKQLRYALTDKEYNKLSQRQSELDGADILEYLQNNNETLVNNAIEFAKDTTFCIWAWLEYILEFVFHKLTCVIFRFFLILQVYLQHLFRYNLA